MIVAGGADCVYNIFVDLQRVACMAATAMSVPLSEIKHDSRCAVNPTQINLYSFGIFDLFKEK